MKKRIALYILTSCSLLVSCAQKTSLVTEAKAFYTQVLPGRAMADENGNTINPSAITERFIYLKLADTLQPDIDTIFYNGIHFTAAVSKAENDDIKIGTLASNGEMYTLPKPNAAQRWWRLDLQKDAKAKALPAGGSHLKIILKGKVKNKKFTQTINSETEIMALPAY